MGLPAIAGDRTHGSIPGSISAYSGAFAVAVRFPSRQGDPEGTTTPEELLAASNAACYGIGLRSLIARRGGQAASVSVTATITADKGADSIHIQSSHLTAIISGLEGLAAVSELEELGRIVSQECTISIALHPSIAISHELVTAP